MREEWAGAAREAGCGGRAAGEGDWDGAGEGWAADEHAVGGGRGVAGAAGGGQGAGGLLAMAAVWTMSKSLRLIGEG